MAVKFGAVEEARLIKAGCGIRYDPEQLGEESGFDFSAAEQMKKVLCDDQCNDVVIEEPKPSEHRSNNNES